MPLGFAAHRACHFRDIKEHFALHAEACVIAARFSTLHYIEAMPDHKRHALISDYEAILMVRKGITPKAV